MTVEYIRYFIEVCRCGSIQKAAKKLFISSQGLGQGIKRLESSIGQSLFVRTQGGVELTEFGKVFYEQACVVDREINKLSSLADKFKSELDEYVVIGLVGNSKYCDWIQSCIREYCEKGHAPMGSMSIRRFKNGLDLINALNDREIGIGVIFHNRERGGLEYLTFSEYSPLVLLVSKNDPLALKESVSFYDLTECQFITAGESDPFTLFLDQLCRSKGFVPNYAFYTTENTYIARLIDSGRGCILLREQYSNSIAQFCTNAAVVRVEPKEMIADSIIVRSGEENTASHCFARHLFELF